MEDPQMRERDDELFIDLCPTEGIDVFTEPERYEAAVKTSDAQMERMARALSDMRAGARDV